MITPEQAAKRLRKAIDSPFLPKGKRARIMGIDLAAIREVIEELEEVND